LFLLSGAILVAVTYVLAARATTITLPGGAGGASGGTPSEATGVSRTRSLAGNGVVHRTPAQTVHLQAQVTQLHDAAMHRLLVGSGVALAVMAVVSIALGWLVAGRVLRPVRTINAVARRIGASNLHERLNLDGPNDEFAELATTLDNLLERLQASFDSQRRFVANASHELRTPLTLDRALLERALRKPQPTQAFWRSTFERLLTSSQQQDRLIEALLTLARSEGAVNEHEPVDLQAVVETVLLSPELNTDNTDPKIRTFIATAPVIGDPRLLERLIHNLIDNAIRYNVTQGHVEVTTGLSAGHAVLTVTNTGPLVPTAEIGRLVQPFQRVGTDRVIHGDGLGLGLSIVHAITTAHQATLTIDPQRRGGLRIDVSFPALADSALAAYATPLPRPRPRLARRRTPSAAPRP
jgi:signal transduction histidine kinase